MTGRDAAIRENESEIEIQTCDREECMTTTENVRMRVNWEKIFKFVKMLLKKLWRRQRTMCDL